MNNFTIMKCFNVSKNACLKNSRISSILRPLAFRYHCRLQVQCLHFSGCQTQSHMRGVCQRNQIVRFCSSQQDKKLSAKRQHLMYFIYLSFAMGGCLVVAIVLNQLDETKQRFKGIERVKDELQTGRPQMIRYKDTMLPIFVERILGDIEDFETDENDIWVVSFPRSGTTLTQELVDLVQSEGDFVRVVTMTLEERFPYFEYMYPGIKSIKKMDSPRLIKSHLPFSLLPKSVREGKAKVIYVARNPKDTCVSYFHFVQLLKPTFRFNGNFNDFFSRFINNKVPYSPWWRHVKEFWDIRDSPNILFLKYEDIVEDLAGTVLTIAEFLGKDIHPMEVKTIAEHCSFDRMKYNKNLNYSWWKETGIADKEGQDFIRKGKVGDWRKMFDVNQNLQIETMKYLKLNECGLRFDEGIEEKLTAADTADKIS
ncbi:sulfotransferase 4A1-like [Mizuhopecten yessoensis]|uniref:Sulfotransferase 4A1 n=1 Tax=Mizuhopecten yessoensis TaxID=6573 RepID=A0A210R3S3_MIZYE|nr:sulfotransferase 4A1-like [Mizuhopecten yessoensis]OWF55574.1 Sulfotransferase 4A1 [Mizuhopecten yessoensis]